MLRFFTRVSLAVSLFVTLLLSSARAHADDIVAPRARLLVDANCVEGMATPSEGLRVLVDGVPMKFLHVDEASFFTVNSDGTLGIGSAPTDVAFDAPPGRHRVRIEADDCAPMERIVTVGDVVPTRVDATLPIADESLEGPTGAPDGMTLVFSAFRTTLPTAMTNDTNPSRAMSRPFVLDDPKIWGGMVSTGWAHRGFMFFFDWEFGMGSMHGATLPKNTATDNEPAQPIDGGILLETGMDLRFGHRYPIGAAALSFGSGIGANLWVASSTSVAASDAGDTRFTWNVPFWADLTMKPSCDVGVQLGASYRWEPGSPEFSTTMLTAGLVFQPNGACKRSPSFEVS
jgi:hypothetical protein